MSKKGSKRIAFGTGIIIYSLCFLSCFLFVGLTRAATLDFSTPADNYMKGGEISADVIVSSANESINTVSGGISFPADKLEIVSISKTDSIFTFWAQEPTFSNTDGQASFAGVIFNPGFVGQVGKIMTIKFKIKEAGMANLNLSSGLVLANDGAGTSVATTLGTKYLRLDKTAKKNL